MPPSRTHLYSLSLEWTGNLGDGTSTYTAYDRDHRLTSPGKASLELSSDPVFRGDAGRYSPEELLVASLSSCHMLWYLHLCADAGIVVTAYVDEPQGTMTEEAGGAGQFTDVLLRPKVTLGRPADEDRAFGLHVEAHDRCFIARSVSFPVRCEPKFNTVTGSPNRLPRPPSSPRRKPGPVVESPDPET